MTAGTKAESGLQPADLEDDDLEVEAVQELAVARNLVETCGVRPGLGTEMATRLSLANFGLLGFAMLSSANAREALWVAPQALQIGNRFVDISVDMSQSVGHIELL